MNTAYYTFTTWEGGAAAGVDGSLAEDRAVVRRARPLGGDNVIDLNAWKAANPELLQEADGPAWEAEEDRSELALPMPRPRKSHRAMLLAEVASTMGVAAAALALVVRVLVF